MRIVAVITDPAVITRILVHRARSLERSLLPVPCSRLPASGSLLPAGRLGSPFPFHPRPATETDPQPH